MFWDRQLERRLLVTHAKHVRCRARTGSGVHIRLAPFGQTVPVDGEDCRQYTVDIRLPGMERTREERSER